MSARLACLFLFVTACGTSSTSDPATTPFPDDARPRDAGPRDAAPPPPLDGGPRADGGCEVVMGAPILASIPNGTSWETSIDAHHGKAVASWISFEGTTIVVRAATSKDGGPFGTPQLVPLEKSWGDPTVRYAPDGTLYIGSICNVTPPVLGGNDICVVSSKDDGATFGPSIRVSPAAKDATNLRDRPWVAIAPDGRVVVSYLDGFIDKDFNILAGGRLNYAIGTRAGDALTFTPPQEIAPGHMPSSGGYNGTYSMPLAFDRNGRFHGTFEIGDPTQAGWELRYTRATGPDLGATEAPRTSVTGGYPVTATAGTSSVGILTYGLQGVVFVRSIDGGDHFEAPVTLGDPTLEARLPWIAGDASGAFHAAWLDRAGEAAPWVVHYQHLPAGPVRTKAMDVASGFTSTDEASDRLLGDFIGIAVDSDGLPKMAWSEPQKGGGAVVRAAFGKCR